MPTYKIHIYGDRNYRTQEVLIDGVNSGNAALDVARSRYPGANVKSAILVDNYDIGRREKHNRNEEERKRKIEEQNQRFRDQEDKFKASASGGSSTSSGTHSVSYDNTNSGGGSSFSGVDIGGLLILAAIGIGGFIAYALAPLVGMFGGAFVGYKYGSKFTQEKNFHIRFWVVLISTISLMVGGTVAGTKLHEVTNFGGTDTPIEQITE